MADYTDEYQRRIRHDLCVRCAKVAPDGGFATCADCRQDMRDRYRARTAGNPPKRKGRPRIY